MSVQGDTSFWVGAPDPERGTLSGSSCRKYPGGGEAGGGAGGGAPTTEAAGKAC